MLNRRKFLLSLLALSTSACVSNRAIVNRKASNSQSPQTFVLVHGAWHGGWCWRDVAKPLLAAGHRVYTPTLSGLGEKTHLLSRDINLTTHVNDIANLILKENLNNVVLVGHSYAGFVVSLVADQMQNRIQSIVYVDAAIPKQGQAFIPQERRAGVLKSYGDDYVLPTPSNKFLGIPDGHEKLAWVMDNLSPHPLGTLLEPVIYKNSGADGLEKLFIRCTGSPRYGENDPVLKLAANNPEWTYQVIDTGHDAMVTAPDELTLLLNAWVK